MVHCSLLTVHCSLFRGRVWACGRCAGFLVVMWVSGDGHWGGLHKVEEWRAVLLKLFWYTYFRQELSSIRRAHICFDICCLVDDSFVFIRWLRTECTFSKDLLLLARSYTQKQGRCQGFRRNIGVGEGSCLRVLVAGSQQGRSQSPTPNTNINYFDYL